MDLKPGARLKSAVCDTEVVVVRPPDRAVTIECGGVPMGSASSATPRDGFADGTLLGKRYGFDDAALEVLCVKPGTGSLSVDGTLMTMREAKQLPSSD